NGIKSSALIFPVYQIFGAAVRIVAMSLVNIPVRGIGLIHIVIIAIFYDRGIMHIGQIPFGSIFPGSQRSIVISIRRTVKTIFHFLLFLIPFAFISIFYTSTILASRQKTNQTERNIYPFKRLHHIFF